MITKIISGGQTGVDQAALDMAIELAIPHGGWCPKGRLSELGTIPEKYQLQETETIEYYERTQLNIQDSDGTLIIVPELGMTINDGTVLTIESVQQQKKPYLLIDLSASQDKEIIWQWIKENQISELNIAGPRESSCPGIYQKALDWLTSVFSSANSLNT